MRTINQLGKDVFRRLFPSNEYVAGAEISRTIIYSEEVFDIAAPQIELDKSDRDKQWNRKFFLWGIGVGLVRPNVLKGETILSQVPKKHNEFIRTHGLGFAKMDYPMFIITVDNSSNDIREGEETEIVTVYRLTDEQSEGLSLPVY